MPLQVHQQGKYMVNLEFEPTRLAYVACTVGLRVALCEGHLREKYCATVSGLTDDGLVSVRIDNSDDERIINPDPSNVLNAKRISHNPGDQLILFHKGSIVSATVSRWHGDENGNRHTVEWDGEKADIDLNDMNH